MYLDPVAGQEGPVGGDVALTFNITNGIGVGFVSYVLIKVARGKAAKVPIGLYVVAVAFLVYFLRWALFDAKF